MLKKVVCDDNALISIFHHIFLLLYIFFIFPIFTKNEFQKSFGKNEKNTLKNFFIQNTFETRFFVNFLVS